jgi:hypothetical protein
MLSCFALVSLPVSRPCLTPIGGELFVHGPVGGTTRAQQNPSAVEIDFTSSQLLSKMMRWSLRQLQLSLMDASPDVGYVDMFWTHSPPF